MKIRLETVNDAGLFVAKCGEYAVDIDYECGRHSVDAKSLMGVLSIGLNRECEVTIHTTDEDLIDKFRNDVHMWTVKDGE